MTLEEKLEVESLERRLAGLEGRAQALESVLRRIVSDLPHKRDWLDPELEKQAKQLVKEKS